MGAGVVMSETPNNPFAFPSLDDGKHNFENGMTLRDWFAGMAIPALIKVLADMSLTTGKDSDGSGIAIGAYEIADMMLKRREATS